MVALKRPVRLAQEPTDAERNRDRNSAETKAGSPAALPHLCLLASGRV
jgi:hypothetical protein